MKKRVITAMVITGALALGACQEDSVLDEVQNIELNEETDPDENEEVDPPRPK